MSAALRLPSRLFTVTEKTIVRKTSALSAKERNVLIRARVEGMTLQVIANITGRSITTVMKYTAAIPNRRRWNKTIRVHRRTGLAA